MKSVLSTLPLVMLAATFCQNTYAAQTGNLVIRLHERVSMTDLAANAVKYGVTYTPEEIRQISGPTDGDYNTLISQLKSEGFVIVYESPTHLSITVRAEKTAARSLFATSFAGSQVVESVVGLENSAKRTPRIRTASHIITSKDGIQPGILPADIKTDYGFNDIYTAGFTGKGQHIAIATYDDLKISDVNQYYQLIGLTSAPTVDSVPVSGTPTYNMDSAMETELDAEFSGMIAPGAAIHIFTSAENSEAGEQALFTAILDDNRAKVVNYSWGSCETNVSAAHAQAMQQIFAQAVAQGVNIMVASGDSGADGCQTGAGAVADYPAIDPSVVAVGGNTLVNANGVFETAWNGSGGGVSSQFALPSYQANFAAPYVKRSIPDVSFNADPNSGEGAWEYADLDGSQSATAPSWIQLGGTSIAAPQWSGFMALVGEARASKGLTTLGYLNPRIYSLSSTAYAAEFHDVTSGNNIQSGQSYGYNAGPGWDAVTGWGSMQAEALFSDLTQ